MIFKDNILSCVHKKTWRMFNAQSQENNAKESHSQEENG